jgi:hypothetical protein
VAEHYYPLRPPCVRFLLDENLSPKICGLLLDAGHEAATCGIWACRVRPIPTSWCDGVTILSVPAGMLRRERSREQA